MPGNGRGACQMSAGRPRNQSTDAARQSPLTNVSDKDRGTGLRSEHVEGVCRTRVAATSLTQIDGSAGGSAGNSHGCGEGADEVSGTNRDAKQTSCETALHQVDRMRRYLRWIAP